MNAPYKPSLPPKPAKPFAEKAKSHPEFRATIIDCLQTFQDEQRDNTSLAIEEAAHVGYLQAIADIRKEIAAWNKGEAAKQWTKEEALQALDQFMDRMDSSSGQDAAQKDKTVEKYRQESASLAWDQAACCVEHAEDIQDINDPDVLVNIIEGASPVIKAEVMESMGANDLALALGQSLHRVTDGEVLFAAANLKHAMPDNAAYWRFIAELSLR